MKRVLIPALLIGASIGLAAPASAAPNPGDPCGNGNGGARSSNGLVCSGQAMIWMSDIGHPVRTGDPCSTPGAVTYGHGEDIVTCRAGTWQPWQR